MATNKMVLKNKGVVTKDVNHERLISKRRRVTLPQWATAWIALIPALIFLTLFMFFPIVNTFISAFIQDFTVQGKTGIFALGQFLNGVLKRNQVSTFGINNFVKVLQLQSFTNSIVNTAILTIIEVPLTIIVSLLIATFLNSIKVLKGFYQTVFFLPYVTNTIALGLVFNIAFGKEAGGIVNVVLTNVFGMDPVNFLDAYAFNAAGKLSNKLTEGVVIVTYSLRFLSLWQVLQQLIVNTTMLQKSMAQATLQSGEELLYHFFPHKFYTLLLPHSLVHLRCIPVS